MTAPEHTAAERRRELLRRRLAEQGLDRGAGDGADAAASPAVHEPGTEVPLSPGQRRMWSIHALDPSTVAYNVGVAIDLDGPLDPDLMRRALETVVARHDVLRTVYRTDAHDRPVQVVRPDLPLDHEHVDVSADADPDGRTDAIARETASRPFDLTVDAPLRVRLVTRGPDAHTLVLVVHHIAWDDSTTPLFFGELVGDYRALAAGTPVRERAPRQFVDVAPLDDTDTDTTGTDFWRETLAPLPEPLALPYLSGWLRPGRETGHEQERTLRAGTAERLRAVAAEHAASSFMVVLAATAALVHRWTGADDVVIGAPVVNRDRAGVETVAGYLGNTIPLRLHVRDTDTVADLVDQARDVSRRAFAHQDVELDRIARAVDPERERGNAGLFDVVLSLRSPALGPFATIGLRAARRPLFAGSARFALTLAVELGEGADADVTVEANHPAAPFADETATSMLRHLDAVLDAGLRDPSLTVVALPLLDDADRAVLASAADPLPAPATRLLPDLVADRAALSPDAPALTWAGETLTYAELTGRAHRLARLLAARGIGPEDRVALALPRSIDTVVAILGVVAAGAAYVPVDPDYPAERVALMLTDSAPRAVLTARSVLDRLPDLDDPILLDEIAPGGEQGPLSDAERVVPLHADHAVYVIYTSGSTGVPKGTVVSHAALAHHLAWALRDFPGLDHHTVVHSSISFDFTVTPLLGTLVAGGRLELSEDTYDGLAAASDRTTFLKITPSHAPLLDTVSFDPDADATLVVAGEALTGEALREFTARRPSRLTLVNEYGPTETTVGALIHVLPPGTDVSDGPVPVGVPVAGLRAHVLDARLGPVPVGALGELYLGGPQVARGYAGRPGQTAARFVADPFGPPGERLYRTGDVVRWRPDGVLVFEGRSDDQVKVRGFRVELGEVEAALARCTGVEQVAVAARDDGPGGTYLAAYAVGDPASFDGDVVLTEVAARLPEQSVPAVIVGVDALPLSPSGKVDRAALPVPQFPAPSVDAAPATGEAPASATEEALAGLFAEMLGLDSVGRDDSFFALGGDSIVSIQLVSKARAAGFPISPRDVFDARTPAALAPLADAARAAAGPAPSSSGSEADDRYGTVAPTPVMQAFADRGGRRDGHHMAVTLTLPADVTRDRLVRAVQTVVDHHDALRARLDGAGLEIPEPGSVDAAQVVTRAPVGADEAAERAAAASRLDPTAGRMVAAVWFPDGTDTDPARLVLVVHHVVVDGVSLRVLADDLAAAWDGTALPPVSTPLRRWTRLLAENAGTRTGELATWREQLGSGTTLGERRLDHDRDTWADAETVTRVVDAATSEGVVTTVPQAFYAGVDDVLLTATGLALAAWRDDRRDGTVVTVEAHGREADAVGAGDLSRTVGWFTSQFPVRLDTSDVDAADALAGGAGAGTVLRRVKERMRTLPDRGLGYGLLRHLAGDAADAELAALPEPEVAVNYLGRFGGVGQDGKPWTLRPGGLDAAYDPAMPMAVPLVLNAVTEGGEGGSRLRVHLSFAPGVVDATEVERLADLVVRALEGLVAHTERPDAGGHTPSDMPLVSLDQGRLDALEARWG